MRNLPRRRTPRTAAHGAALLVVALVGAAAAAGTVALAGGSPNPSPNDPPDVAASSGAYIIDAGAVTAPSTEQTIAEGLSAYGLVHALVQQHIPVHWVIDPDKPSGAGGSAADVSQSLGNVGVDFSVDCDGDGPDPSKDYATGSFVVPAEFGPQAAALIDTWRGLGAVVDGPCVVDTPTLPVFAELRSWPVTLIDDDSASIVTDFFANAQIPQGSLSDPARPPAYRIISSPADLTACDEFYAMPHATPDLDSHLPLVQFVQQGGSMWAACDGVTTLENILYPPEYPDPALQNTHAFNFLATSGLLASGAAADTPYSYFTDASDVTAWGLDALDSGDPIAQFRGTIDHATDNGTTTAFLPAPGSAWRPTTQVVVYDPTHADVPTNSPGPAAVMLYGPAYGDADNGDVMYVAGHEFNTGTDEGDEVAVQRAFFNMLLLTQVDSLGPQPAITAPANTIDVGSSDELPVEGTATGGSGGTTYSWEAACFDRAGTAIDPGTFAEPAAANTTFTAPSVLTRSHCNLTLVVTDDCGHITFTTRTVGVLPVADVSITKTGSRKVSPGGRIIYRITVTNNGVFAGTTTDDGADAAGVVVTDVIPDGTTFVAVSDPEFSATAPAGASCAELNGAITCELGDMLDEQTATMIVEVTAPDTSGYVDNTAVVAADSGDPDPTNNEATHRTRITGPSIMLDLVADRASVPGPLGADVAFTFTVTNTSNGALEAVVVRHDPDDCFIVGPTGDLDVDDLLDVDEEWQYTCNRLIDVSTADVASDLDPATKRGIATVVALDRNARQVSDTDSATVTVLLDPPVGRDDVALTSLDQSILLAPLANDPTRPLDLTAITQPTHGVAELLPDDTVRYTPATGFVGVDVFTYTACDLVEQCVVQVVSITVSELPTVGNDPATITELAIWTFAVGLLLMGFTLRRRRLDA